MNLDRSNKFFDFVLNKRFPHGCVLDDWKFQISSCAKLDPGFEWNAVPDLELAKQTGYFSKIFQTFNLLILTQIW